MPRIAAIVLLAASCLAAATPSLNFASYLGAAQASAAVTDPAGNIYIVAGATLLQLAGDGSLLSNTQPAGADAVLTSVALDGQGRVILGGSNASGGFVARPPDFSTAVAGKVVQVAVDPNGNLWAVTATANLVQLSSDGAVTLTKFVGGASDNTASDMVIDAAGSIYVSLVTNSAELPASSGFEPFLNGVAGSLSYDGGGYFYPVYGVTAAINQWLLTDPNTLYVATQGQGVNHSSDRGQTFDSRSQGLPDLRVNMVAADPTNAQVLYAATRQGLAKSSNAGVSWNVMPLSTAEVAAITVHLKNRAHLYVALAAPLCGVYRSTDTGATWQPQQIADGCVTRFLADPNDVNGVYAATGSGVYALPASGSAWTLVSAIDGLNSVAADSVVFSTWYASATDGVYKSMDTGATWTLINPGEFTSISAGRPYVVAGTRGGSIAVSINGGASWNQSSPFAQPVRSLLTDSGTIFAGAAYNTGIWLGKFSSFDGQLLSSTFLGGSGSETAARLAVDGQGVVTVAMDTDSTDVATTLDAAQRRPGGGTDIVVTRLTPAFALQYASYFGGSGDEHIGGIKLDAQGFLYIAGSTQSQDLPVSANALQSGPLGGKDAFSVVLNPSANGLLYSSYVGGSADDQGIAFVPDNRGNAVFIGRTPSDSFAMSLAGLIGYQPLGAIRNAATLLPGSPAPGSLATIDGAFGALSGISVTFNGIPATIIESSDASMDVEVPSGLTPGQPASLVIQSRNGLSQGTVPIAAVTPGLFSANHDGKGVAQATLLRVDADGNEDSEQVFQCSDTCTALSIDFGDDSDTLYLQMTATGLRGEPDLSQFQVLVNGQAATVVSAAAQGISPGLDQLTIQLPRPADGFIGPAVWTIQVTVDGKTSNRVTITVG